MRRERAKMLEDLDLLCGWPCSLTELPAKYAELAQAAQKRADALMVLVRTPHIRAYLAAADPKALEQAEKALES